MQLGIIGSLAGSTRDVEGAPQPKVALERALTARPISRVQEAEVPVNRGSTRDGRDPPIQVVLLGTWRQFSRVQEAIMPSLPGLRGVFPATIRRSVDRVWKRDYIVFSTLTVPAQSSG